jgi:RND superfamily putative drug exporter
VARGGTALVVAIPTEDGNSPRAATLDRLRNTTEALPVEVTIGGQAAQGADFLDAVYSNFLLLIGLISLLTFILLARAFRSLVLPLVAVLLNLLSVAAAWGLIVLVLAEGVRLRRDLGDRSHTSDQRADADRRLRLLVRHLDGLPGVHHQPDARGIRPHRFDRRGGRRGHRSHRAPRHECGAHPVLAFVAFSAQPGTEAKIFATALGGGILLDATIIRGFSFLRLSRSSVAGTGGSPDWAARLLRVESSPLKPAVIPIPRPRQSEWKPTPSLIPMPHEQRMSTEQATGPAV